MKVMRTRKHKQEKKPNNNIIDKKNEEALEKFINHKKTKLNKYITFLLNLVATLICKKNASITYTKALWQIDHF